MKSSKRALRRHHAERMKIKCRRVYPHDIHAKAADNLTTCSCFSCGNPRKFFKQKTWPELQSHIDLIDQLSQLGLHQGRYK